MSERTSIEEIRERLSESRGPEYWQTLEELADHEAFRELVSTEFPAGADQWLDPVSRRRFLHLMGASLALAGASACTRQPLEKIVPYVKQPEEMIPGVPRYFASALALGGLARGVVVETHEGRPTKIEGNELHPASLGATDPSLQAEILSLYDPDRKQVVTLGGRIRPWSAFRSAITTAMASAGTQRGSGVRLLTETVTSPTLARLIGELLAKFPDAKWHQFEPTSRDAAKNGAKLAFGDVVDTHHRIDRADVIVSLDADLFGDGGAKIRYAREYARRRRVDEHEGETATAPRSPMVRLYSLESTPTITGARADHRLALPAREIEAFARALAHELGVDVEVPTGGGSAVASRWVRAVADDLKAHGGAGIVAVGDGMPPVVHALAHAMNHVLGNVGRTVVHTVSPEASPVDQHRSLEALLEDVDAGEVSMLLIAGGNPAYGAPAELDFARRVEKVGLRVHLGLETNETSALCQWSLPEAHGLETWGDLRAFDGTVSIQQPLIQPLYDGISAIELVALLGGDADPHGHDLVQATWSKSYHSGDFAAAWRQWLHDGLIPGTAYVARAPKPKTGGFPAPSGREAGLEVTFRADPTIHDGRYANNGWLQELPKPLTKLTWENAAYLSPATAARLGLSDTDIVELRYAGRSVEAPVAVLPGQPDDSVALHLGYGRTQVGRVGQGAGFDAFRLRTVDRLGYGSGLEIVRTGRQALLAYTQTHYRMEGRHLVREATLEHFREQPDFAHHVGHHVPGDLSMFPPHEYSGHAWGLTIDLNACIGCNACAVACQSENNIAVVGKVEVERGREMAWIRVDRYFKGDATDPEIETVFQPIPCMHCENAPCEVVCPVGATTHSDEGLNDMVYNRCVGTRYCSNNCPYKVRRFNFFKYSDLETTSLKLMRNPDVTVRTRGVMEKCTYCVQRINAARIPARREGRTIRDGEIVTACQQACPTEAIRFGDVNDPESRVSKAKASPRNYTILDELNTKPRTSYLAAVRNPNPALGGGSKGDHGGGHGSSEGSSGHGGH